MYVSTCFDSKSHRQTNRWIISEVHEVTVYILGLQQVYKGDHYYEITWNANLMQQGNFSNVFLARHVSGTYARHQEQCMLCCSVWLSAPSFWMGGGLENCCVGRVYGADGAVARHHPHSTHDPRSGSQDHHPTKNFGAENHMLQLNI